MCEERRLTSPDLAKHLPGPTYFVLQPLVFSPQPSLKVPIQRVKDRVQSRALEAAVVVHPATKHWIDLLSHIHQGNGMPTMQPPSSDRPPDRFGCFRTDRWEEPREQCSRPGLCSPGTEPIAKEVELEHLMVHATSAIPTEDDSRLFGMQLQVALFHSNFQSCLERLRFLQTATVADHIIRISLERSTGIIPAHPFIEPVMQEQICQQRAPHAIATELNAAKIPSPGAKWKRTKRVTGQWLASAISGDPKRGIGILNNSLYMGIYRWNRTHWPKDPDTKMHVCRPRPPSEWVQLPVDESLRIVDDGLWHRVKQRQARQTTVVGEAVKRGIARGKHTGRGPKYLLSGVMVCADCGRPMNMVSKPAYSCPAYHDGGPSACANGVLVNRVVAEDKLLHGIKNELLSSSNVDKLKRKVRRILVEQQAASGAERQVLETELATITTEIERYVTAIGAGMMSPTLRVKLEAADVAKARIEARLGQTPASDRHIFDMVPALVDRVHEIVGDFEARVYAAGGPAVARARMDLKHMLGTVPVKGVLEGHKRVPYALIAGSPRLVLSAASGENALTVFLW